MTVEWQWQAACGAPICHKFPVHAGELAAVPLARLEAAVGEADAQWLSQLARGIDLEEVRGGPARERGRKGREEGGIKSRVRADFVKGFTAIHFNSRRVGCVDLELVRSKLHDEG